MICIFILLVILILIEYYWYRYNIYNSHIYLDNNATTQPSLECVFEFNKHIYHGNASALYGQNAKNILNRTRNKILECAQLDPSEYIVILTSGASESINVFINTLMKYNNAYNIITSSYEHTTTLDCVRQYKNVTYINPNPFGYLHPQSIPAFKTPCIVSLIMTHNEIGNTNYIHKQDLPLKDCIYHVDAVQSFGKYPLVTADAYTFSFHKLYGFPGIGALVIHKSLYPAFKAYPQICGHQNYNLRGGTENIALIASVYGALNQTFKNRLYKNIQLYCKKNYILAKLNEYYPVIDYGLYVANKGHKVTPYKYEFTVINLNSINTLFLSTLNPYVCKYKLQKALLKQNIIVGTGSACNSNGDNHVLKALDVPQLVKQGTLRISVGDNNTYRECKKFVIAFIKVLDTI